MLKEEIQNDLKTAIKERDEESSLVLRSLISAINNKEIETGKREEGLGDDEVSKVVLTEIKKRKEASEQYTKGGREDLAEQEVREAEILQKYAPEQLSEEELEAMVDDIIEETGASEMKDMGSVIKGVMAKAGNKADGSMVSSIVKKKLQ